MLLLSDFVFSYSEDSPFGPLTQRLVSALIEENVMTAFDDSMAEVNPGGSTNVTTLVLLKDCQTLLYCPPLNTICTYPKDIGLVLMFFSIKNCHPYFQVSAKLFSEQNVLKPVVFPSLYDQRQPSVMLHVDYRDNCKWGQVHV